MPTMKKTPFFPPMSDVPTDATLDLKKTLQRYAAHRKMKSREAARAIEDNIPDDVTPSSQIKQPLVATTIRVDQIFYKSDWIRRPEEGLNLEELKAAIREVGLLQPIIVRQPDAAVLMFEVIAGERRLEAHRELGLTEIDALVSTSEHHQVIGLIENLQRVDLHPVVEAEMMERLKKEYNYTDAQLGRMLGQNGNTITQRRGIANLPTDIREDAKAQDKPVSRDLLIEISKCNDEKKKHELWDQAKGGANSSRIESFEAGCI